MKYFTTCTTLDELKKEFRRLAMLHHPEKNHNTPLTVFQPLTKLYFPVIGKNFSEKGLTFVSPYV